MLVLLSVTAVAPSARASEFSDALRRACPAKRLDLLAYGNLLEAMQPFLRRLSPDRRSRLEQLAKPYFDACPMGFHCATDAYIKAARRMKLTPALLTAICRWKVPRR